MAPILVFLSIGVIDFGAGTYRQMQVQEAAQLGAQYAVIHGFDASAISDQVATSTAFSTVTATPAPTSYCGCVASGAVQTATCGSQCANGVAAGSYVTVRTAAQYSTTLAYPSIPRAFSLSGQATVRLQ